MLKRIALTLIAFVTLSGLLSAQEDPVKLVIKLSQGESTVFDDVNEAQFNDELGKFLKGASDGVFELQQGSESLVFTKIGTVLRYEERKAPLEMTVDEAIEKFWDDPKTAPNRECLSNLKNLGTAAEMYWSDFNSEYPTDISKLAPNYLKEIPTCPISGKAYSYHRVMLNGDKLYEFSCNGDHEEYGLQKGYPRYNGLDGVVQSSEQDSAKGAKEY